MGGNLTKFKLLKKLSQYSLFLKKKSPNFPKEKEKRDFLKKKLASFGL
jgi:hypothetical protein